MENLVLRSVAFLMFVVGFRNLIFLTSILDFESSINCKVDTTEK